MRKRHKFGLLLLGGALLLCCPVRAAATELEVSEKCLVDPVYSVTRHSEDTYDISVTVTANGLRADSENIRLKAACGSMVQEQRYVVPGQYSFLFSGMSECLDASLTLYENDNGSKEDETVYEEIRVGKDLILNVRDNSYDGMITVYDLYKVSDQAKPIEEFHSDILRKYKTRDNLIATLMTDDSGRASYNFTQNGQPEGTYLIVDQVVQEDGTLRGIFFTMPYQTTDPQTYHHTRNIATEDFKRADYDLPAAEYMVLPDTGGLGSERVKGIGLLLFFCASALILNSRRKRG